MSIKNPLFLIVISISKKFNSLDVNCLGILEKSSPFRMEEAKTLISKNSNSLDANCLGILHKGPPFRS